ncbi:hypothetical protein Pmani_016738 [Petrolisthes manimaculis]|uniref:Mediator of DNA damage checkpoint protein 1 n=1 Tax=Petrolisthes manimaculis TaxID=1843537 RepID=A0AAE1U8G2_9EUCA|nr:hypothetical protein Pmani_016738 [Petrolisthes manimaculis]
MMDDTQVLDCTQALPDDFDEDIEEGPSIVAWVEVNGERFDVTRGETKIGRDPEACRIEINSTALSREHAVIETDGDVHTLADLGSRNKTKIGRMILKPNVRYALQGGETLTFGNVTAIYIKKAKSQDVDSGSETESESMLHLEMSEDRTHSPTLTHHLPGLDSPMPQKGNPESDISDIIPETPQPVKNMPGNRTIIPESPTLSQSTPKPKENGPAIGSKPSDISPIKKMDEVCDDGFSFDSSQPERRETTKLGKIEKQNSNTDINNYNSDASTDIDDDDNLTQVFSDLKNPSSSKEEAKLKPKVVDEGDEKGWSSDASTDIEDVFNEPTQPFPSSGKTPNLEKKFEHNGCTSPGNQSYEDCTQDIMAVFGLKGKANIAQQTNELEASTPSCSASGNKSNNKEEEVDLEASTQAFNVSEQETVFRKPLATAPKPKRKSKGQLNESLDMDFLDAPTQTFTSETDDADVFNAPTQPFTNDIPKDNFPDESVNNSVFDAPTQPFDKDSTKDDIFDAPTQPFDKDSTKDDIFDAPTQPFDKDLTKDDIFDAPTQPFDKDSTKDDIFDAPTQPFDKDSTKDDIFDAPTQPFCENATKTDISNALTQPFAKPIPLNRGDTNKVNNSSTSQDRATLDTLHEPTQEFIPSHQNTCTSVVGKAQLETHSDSDDDIDELFNAPTQPFQPDTKVSGLSEGKGSNKDDLSDSDDDVDIFNQPTQVFSEGKKADVDLNAATQAIDTAVALQQSDSLVPTQPDVTAREHTVSEHSCDSEETVLRNSSVINDPDLDAPTQIMEDELYNAPTQPFSEVSKMGANTPKPVGLTKSIIQLWDGLDNIPETQHTTDTNSKTSTIIVEHKSNVKGPETESNDNASDTSETLLTESQYDDEYKDILNKNVEKECVFKTGDSLHTDLTNVENKKRSDTTEEENYNSDVSTDMEDESPTPPKSNTSREKQTSESSLQEQSIDSGIGGSKPNILLPINHFQVVTDQEDQENEGSQVTLSKTGTISQTKTDQGKKKMLFKRMSNLGPMATSSNVSQHSGLSKVCQDSSTCITFPASVFNFEFSNSSDSNDSNDSKDVAMSKGSRRDGNYPFLTIDSDSEPQANDVSQPLFELSPSSIKSIKLEIRGMYGSANRASDNCQNGSSPEQSSKARNISSTPKSISKIYFDKESLSCEDPLFAEFFLESSSDLDFSGFSTSGSHVNEAEAVAEENLVENEVAKKLCTALDVRESDCLKMDIKEDADDHADVEKDDDTISNGLDTHTHTSDKNTTVALNDVHSLQRHNESISNINPQSDDPNLSVASCSSRRRSGRRRKVVNNDTIEQKSCPSPQPSSSRQTRQKRSSLKDKSSEIIAADNTAKPGLPSKDDAETKKQIYTKHKRGKGKSTPVPPIEESIPASKTEIKTDNTNEELDLDHLIPDIQIKVEVKLEETVGHIELPTRSRRKCQVPNRYSPEKEVKTIKKRGRKSNSVQVKQEPLEMASSTTHAGILNNVQEMVKQEPSTDGGSNNIEERHSVPDSENDPTTDVKIRRSRGRPKLNTSAAQETSSSKPVSHVKRLRASTGSAQPTLGTVSAPQGTTASRVTDHSDLQIAKIARLDTISESSDQDADIKPGRKSRTKKPNDDKSTSVMQMQSDVAPSTSGVTVAKTRRASNKRVKGSISDELPEDISQSSEESVVPSRARKRHTSEDSTDQASTPSKSLRRGRSRKGSPPPSERQQRANNKPRVLFTGYKDVKDEKIVTELGGFLVESPQSCSVLVTTRVCRTFKLLAVIGKGQPIVSPAWLTACKSARCFVDPWQYLVEDRNAEEEFGFNLEQSLQSASKVSLFEGLAIHATPSVKPSPIQMKEIIVCSGGRYLAQPPKKFGPQILIVSCQDDQKHWPNFKRLGIPILGTEFVLTGLLRHELLLDEFLLS